jgi:hypothetical protein
MTSEGGMWKCAESPTSSMVTKRLDGALSGGDIYARGKNLKRSLERDAEMKAG